MVRKFIHWFAICVVWFTIIIEYIPFTKYIPGYNDWCNRVGFEWMQVVWGTE